METTAPKMVRDFERTIRKMYNNNKQDQIGKFYMLHEKGIKIEIKRVYIYSCYL